MGWSDGYHTEAEYTSGYYKELSPSFQRFAALLNGYELPVASQDDVHMELGFGQGISINIHAATHIGHYIGNDFNPNHAMHAQQLAASSKVNITLSDDSFAQLANQDVLPMCSSISLHGIWSWISDENRQHIIKIIQRALKPGGIVYNSYNTTAGHAAFLPWRQIMWQHYQQQTGSAIQKIEATIVYLSQIFQENPHLLENNTILKSTWARIQTADRHYLLHEYFNQNWDCFSLHEMTSMLEAAKLQFIGTTNVQQYLNQIFLNQKAFEQISAQRDLVEGEAWRDLLTNNTFRRDLYVKGGQKLQQWQILERLMQQHFVLVVREENLNNYLVNPQDSRQFNQDLFEPIKATLAQNNYQPKTFETLLQSVDKAKYNWINVLQVLLLKIEANQIQVCSDIMPSKHMQNQTLDLNRALLKQLDVKLTGSYVAVVKTGLGLSLDLHQAWLLRTLLERPKAKDEDVARNIWNAFQANGQVLIHNGERLTDEASHFAVWLPLIAQLRDDVPVWRNLGLL